MQFKVPQFIDVEDKIFGPFTFRQFIYLAGGAGMIFVVYKLLPFWIGVFIMIPIAILAALLTFYKINNKPFIYYLQAGIAYAFGSKLYIWKQRLVKHGEEKKEEETLQKVSMVPTLSSSKLKDLSWSLDIKNTEDDE